VALPRVFQEVKVKGIAAPLLAWQSPEDSRKIRERESSPITVLTWPRVFQKVKVKV